MICETVSSEKTLKNRILKQTDRQNKNKNSKLQEKIEQLFLLFKIPPFVYEYRNTAKSLHEEVNITLLMILEETKKEFLIEYKVSTKIGRDSQTQKNGKVKQCIFRR